MAEAFARILGDNSVEAWSAGSTPSGKVSQRAIESMMRLGYDLSSQRSKSLEDLPVQEYHAVVTMGCGDAFPAVPARLREDWQIRATCAGVPCRRRSSRGTDGVHRIAAVGAQVGGHAGLDHLEGNAECAKLKHDQAGYRCWNL